MSQKTVVIIGGGIAGTTCAEYIAAYSSEIKIILVAATDVIKTGITTKQLTKLCGEVNIAETSKEEFENQVDNLVIKIGVAVTVNADGKNNTHWINSRSSQFFEAILVGFAHRK